MADEDWDDDDAGAGGGGGDEDNPGEGHDQYQYDDGAEVEGNDDDGEEEEDILDMEPPAPAQRDALLMRFCPHDSSMLYPRESRRERALQYACRLCRHAEPAPGAPLVYRNERKKEVVRPTTSSPRKKVAPIDLIC
jgi:hypothetical protein